MAVVEGGDLPRVASVKCVGFVVLGGKGISGRKIMTNDALVGGFSNLLFIVFCSCFIGSARNQYCECGLLL